MMCAIYYGKIRKDKIATWETNDQPFDILEKNISVKNIGAWVFLSKANDIFTDKTQVDWGSFAYKCTKEQLQQLIEQTNCEIDGLEEMEATAEYGIVFIELP